MKRFLALGVFLLLISSVSLFYVKHKVLEIERALARTHHSVFEAEENLHLLQAEWVYLNHPQRLQRLATEHLGMVPVQPFQVAALNEIPLPGKAAISPESQPEKSASCNLTKY